jgi:hypothetical protein
MDVEMGDEADLVRTKCEACNALLGQCCHSLIGMGPMEVENHNVALHGVHRLHVRVKVQGLL